MAHRRVQSIVKPDAFKCGTSGTRELPRPMSTPCGKVTFEDVAIRVVEAASATAFARRKLASITLAVGVDHDAVAVGDTSLRLLCRSAHAAFIDSTVREPDGRASC